MLRAPTLPLPEVVHLNKLLANELLGKCADAEYLRIIEKLVNEAARERLVDIID
jgi:hypothetical protein